MTCVIGIVQARVGSTRLPGKALMDLSAKPMLQHVIERMQVCRRVQRVVLATTAEPGDRPLLDLARRLGIEAFAGSVDDVLDRTYQAASRAGAEVVVRITGDDPLKDPGVTDRVIAELLESGVDYASNTLVPTFPEGVDIEVCTYAALVRAWREAELRSEREHVTPYIWKHPDRFRTRNVSHPTDLSRLRWTVDYPEDLAFVRAVYGELYHGRVFGMNEVLALLERRPELALLNSGRMRNEGYERSVRAERSTDSPANDQG
jgi:spore coat polysaccharide biosynthesis protein SpsF